MAYLRLQRRADRATDLRSNRVANVWFVKYTSTFSESEECSITLRNLSRKDFQASIESHRGAWFSFIIIVTTRISYLFLITIIWLLPSLLGVFPPLSEKTFGRSTMQLETLLSRVAMTSNNASFLLNLFLVQSLTRCARIAEVHKKMAARYLIFSKLLRLYSKDAKLR